MNATTEDQQAGFAPALFSSSQGNWATPQWLFDLIDRRFQFGLDAAAVAATAKCERYFGPDAVNPAHRDALSISWVLPGAPSVFVNPPYGRGVNAWVAKAFDESRQGVVVVCLLMARTDTRWWHSYVMRAAEVWLIAGRVRFVHPVTGLSGNAAPAPSCVVVFRGEEQRPEFVALPQPPRAISNGPSPPRSGHGSTAKS